MEVNCYEERCKWNNNQKCNKDIIEINTDEYPTCCSYENSEDYTLNSFIYRSIEYKDYNNYVLLTDVFINLNEIYKYIYDNSNGDTILDLTLKVGTKSDCRFLKICKDGNKLKQDKIKIDSKLKKISCDIIRDTNSIESGILTSVQRRMIKGGMNI